MKNYFAIVFEDARHERTSILLLSLTGEIIWKQSGFLEHELGILKNLALEIYKNKKH